MKKLTLKTLGGTYAVSRLSLDTAIPGWAFSAPFFSITRTENELSLVCSESRVPDEITCEKGWKCFQIVDPLDFSEIGILSSLSRILADAGISIFALSTFDTDYIMVKSPDFEKAIDALTVAGHRVIIYPNVA